MGWQGGIGARDTGQMGRSLWGSTRVHLQQARGGAGEQPCRACRCAPERCRARERCDSTGWGQLSGHEGTNAAERCTVCVNSGETARTAACLSGAAIGTL